MERRLVQSCIAAAASAVALLPSTASGIDDCARYEIHPHTVDILDDVLIADAVIEGHLAYTTWTERLTIYDLSDPVRPRVLSTTPMPNVMPPEPNYPRRRTFWLNKVGDLLFVSNDTVGLAIFDVSDVAAPELIVEHRQLGSLRGTGFHKDHLYLTEASPWGFTGLTIFEASDLERLNVVATVPTPGGAVDLEIIDDVAFVVEGQGWRPSGPTPAGIMAFDVSDPENVTLLSRLELPSDPSRILMHEGLAYVRAAGTHVIDLSDPLSMRILSTISYLVDALWRDRAFAGGLAIDISDPAQPAIIDRVSSADRVDFVVDGYAYIRNFLGYGAIIELGNMVQVSALGSIQVDMPIHDIFLGREYAFVAGRHLAVVDRTSDPVEPAAMLEMRRTVVDVTVRDDFAYLAGLGDGLIVVDVSKPTEPQQVARGAAGYAREVALLDHYAYLAGSSSGLVTFDISDPTAPELVGGHHTGGYAFSVCVAGDHAFVGNIRNEPTGVFSEALQVYDLADPASPRLVAEIEGASIERVLVAGDILYGLSHRTFDRDGWLVTVDVSDPTAPRSLARVPLLVAGRDLTLLGSHAYVSTEEEEGLLVFDVSDPAAPSMVGQRLIDSQTRGVVAGVDRLFVGDWDGIITTLPSQCVDFGAVETAARFDGSALHVSMTGFDVAGSRAAPWRAPAGTTGPSSFRRVGSATPIRAGQWTYADDTVVTGESYVYELAIETADGVITRVGPIAAVAVEAPDDAGPAAPPVVTLRVAPNPMRHSTTLTLRGVGEAGAAVSIVDAPGRLVRRLETVGDDGGQTARWDGRDSRGAAVAAGLYFVRASWRGGELTERVMVLR